MFIVMSVLYMQSGYLLKLLYVLTYIIKCFDMHASLTYYLVYFHLSVVLNLKQNINLKRWPR